MTVRNKETILIPSTLMQNLCFFDVMCYWFSTVQKQPPEVFRKKGVPKNFANFTGKHLC